MKRFIICILILSVLFISCSCAPLDFGRDEQGDGEMQGSISVSGVWISFSEINGMLDSQKGFEAELEEVVSNCKSLEITDVYIHVRSYCDSLFKSEYFPLVTSVEKYDYDVFAKMIEAFHQSEIRVHAWINPYRVLTSSCNTNALPSGSPAYKWLNDGVAENDVNVCISDGIYLNPAEAEVRKLVIDGIREIIANYDVDGIHFDDYFYPTTDAAFDSQSYENYKRECENPLLLDDWRRANVNALISGCYTAVKFADKDILFSISPAASIDKNFQEMYADVKNWVESGCVDYIIPQLYFGFDYPLEEYKFDTLLAEWKELGRSNPEVGLAIGLATYKIATDNEPDRTEWESGSKVICRQASLCFEDSAVMGYAFFSYTSLFDERLIGAREREELLKYSGK